MTNDFAAPPAPDGVPSGTVRRADFRVEPPAPRRRSFPRWLIVLLAAGGAVIVGGVVTQMALTVRASHLEPAEPGATGRLHSAQVVSGMCLQTLGDEAGIVWVVPCEDSHAAEVVTAYTFTGADFPGDDAVAKTALDFCAAQLAPGGALDSALDSATTGRKWVAWVPSMDTWNSGDRSGLCIVTAPEPWQGSAAAN